MKINGLHNRQKEIISQIIHSSAKYHSIIASRQSGKSVAISKLAIILGMTINSGSILLVSPSYEQSRILYDNIISTVGIEKIIKHNKTSKPYELVLISDTILKFRSAEKFEFIRGGSHNIVIMDEMAFTKSGVFEKVIRPTTAAKPNSKIIVASTPLGKFNSFYELCKLGEDEEQDNYKLYRMHYSDNPYYDINEINDARARLPKDVFDQEYEAIFIDDGGKVFDNLKAVMTIYSYQPFENGNRYYGGLDFARVNDASVLTILDKDRNVVFIESYRGDWNKQFNDISLVLNIYKPVIYGESNGIGDVVLSQLAKKYPAIRPFLTTNSSKKEIVEQLKMDIYTESIQLPTEELCLQLYKEMTNFTYSISSTGLIRYHHPVGGNDDYVDSLAIANYAYTNHNKGTFLRTSANSFYN